VNLAIVKPDHIGDLILSTPAIRAVAAEYPDVTLFVASKTLALARYLFPNLDLRTMDMPHLLKAAGQSALPDLTSYDLVLFLRRDGQLTPEWAALRTRDYVMPAESHADHQSILDYGVVSEVVIDYDMDALFFEDRFESLKRKALGEPSKIGFSIGSGFYTNIWPLTRWIETGLMLQSEGRDIYIICGPEESAAAAFLARQLGLNASRIITGSNDFAALFAKLDELDLVIASDGGTAHLCSMQVPLISLFGSSPINRYVPFGKWHRTISLRLSCSPCCQYSTREVNGCLSVECMSEIDAEDVRAAMAHTMGARPRVHASRLGRGRTLFVGLSHIDQQQKIALRRAESSEWSL
jgi:ADP-heptose:LPS heptosyltransferase